MKILCFINHFFGKSNNFTGGSTNFSTEKAIEKRKNFVINTIQNFKKFNYNIDIVVCSIKGNSLIDADLYFDNVKDTPLLLIYESLNKLYDYINNYDYFINIEDDIIFPENSFNKITEFDNLLNLNEVIIPNRMEEDSIGNLFCVDLYCIPGWKNYNKIIGSYEFKMPINPHSGILVLSKEKLDYAFSQIDKKFRGIIIASELESAFAYFHSPFNLLRNFNQPSLINIYHQDKFKFSPHIFIKNYPYFPFEYKYRISKYLELIFPSKYVYKLDKKIYGFNE